MKVLGIEGTAWAASAAVYDADADEVIVESDAYVPDDGGIHPRDAAEHMREAIPQVVEIALDRSDEVGAPRAEGPPIDAVAFSRGPGLGPCLRTVGTAARTVAGSMDVPLVGVNHMVAHLEIGRHRSGFDAPVGLNASGANAHLLGYHRGRYRVLGETMDTGVGNAIDKVARHVGWSHPGGPKVEAAARDGEYLDLPYVVKGMDFSFSGIATAAMEAYDEGARVEDVCCGLQETIFAMLTEVSERALSLTGSDELVLGGGVGQNERLREMLAEMCAARGAEFFAPEPRFLRDNAGMIAVLGSKQLTAGDTLPIDESAVRPNWRPDQVAVSWRDAASVVRSPTDDGERQGAEAVVNIEDDRVEKRRLPKTYRHPDLDRRLRRERTAAEARLTSEARRLGVPTPVICDLDPADATIVFERVGTIDLGADATADRVRRAAGHLSTLHRNGIVHGDPTTRNVRAADDRVYLIDFGLGFGSDHPEDHAMDLHVLDASLRGTADDPSAARAALEEGYRERGDEAVIERLREIEGRGRYR